MSHSKERTEKICLNCNAALTGRFCHVCGQENIEPKETVWSLVSHFFYDITHFDGKFFSTTGTLIRRPGKLPKEYIIGRRARYLHPIRMYVFTSAVFFLIFFSRFSANSFNFGSVKDAAKGGVAAAMGTAKEKALEDADTKEDSIAIEKAFAGLSQPSAEEAKADSAKAAAKKKRRLEEADDDAYNWNIDMPEVNYESVAAYDSVQKALPAARRDGWWKHLKIRRSLEIKEKYHGDKREFARELIERFLHTFPYLLFISLPLYALFLKLLYLRRRQFYYVDHGIWLLYLYIFTFIFLLVLFGMMDIKSYLGWKWLYWVELLFCLYGVYYACSAMHRFYGQSRTKTFFKFLLFNFMAAISLVILFVLFFTLAVFRV